jgi:hypothetical protein
MLRFRILLASLPLLLAAACVSQASAAPLAAPAASCTSRSYAYAGLISRRTGAGIKATLTALAPAQVRQGHVAAWIGVGSTNAGPGDQAQWLQTGLNALADGSSELYAELTQPGRAPRYQTILAHVDPGVAYHVAVVRLAGKPDAWQVFLNGKRVTAEAYLPGSSRFQPMAMSESWNGGSPVCNGFAYRFANLQVATQRGSWQPLGAATTLADSGYVVRSRTTAGFIARSA